MSLIGITGKKQVGKDTLADITGFKRVGFADELKRFCNEYFDVIPDGDKEGLTHVQWRNFEGITIPTTRKHDKFLTRREVWQTVGTDVIGNHVPRFWIDAALKLIIAYTLDNYNVVVPDVRYNKEASAIKHLGGVIVRLHRDLPGQNDAHDSEAGISDKYVDLEVFNDGSIDDLKLRWGRIRVLAESR